MNNRVGRHLLLDWLIPRFCICFDGSNIQALTLTTSSHARPGVEYTARVSAENKAGTSDWSEPISVSTQATVPSVPSEPLCSSIGFGFVGVTWAAPAETGGSEVTSYTLELEEGPEGAGFIAKYNGPNTGYILQGVKPLLPYRFRVKAGNAVGWSHFSSVLEVVGSCGASGTQESQTRIAFL